MNIEITIDGDVDQDAAGAIVAGLAECARLQITVWLPGGLKLKLSTHTPL